MDFVFAAFPWWITWNLTMRRAEKIGLCAAMSLGMIVAITSLGRVIWRQDPIHNVHDKYYACKTPQVSLVRRRRHHLPIRELTTVPQGATA